MKIKIYYMAIFIIIANSFLKSQNIVEFDNNLFVSYYKANRNSISITQINNKSNKYTIIIDSLVLANPRLDILAIPNKTDYTLKPKTSSNIGFRLFSKHNLQYKLRFYVYFTIKELNTQIVNLYNYLPKFIYEDIFEEFTQNKFGLELKNALKEYLNNHTALSYKEAREKMFGEIDNEDGWVECIYTGRKIQTKGIPDINQTGFNTEHTWPQAFFNENDSASRSDLFHIYPSDETANSKRANYPFDNVSQVQWQNGGSKLGKNQTGETVFEPRNENKGNIARSLFYFALRYNNPKEFLNSQEKILREWSLLDTIDKKELSRNDKISKLQNKYNPFISHPEFLERIKSISTDEDYPATYKAILSVKQAKVTSDFIDIEKNFNVYITNSGNRNLTLNKIELIHQNGGLISEIKNLSLPVEIPVDSVLIIKNQLFNIENQQNQFTKVKLTINNEIFEYDVEEVNFNSVKNTISNSVVHYSNDELIISTERLITKLKIYDILGNAILERILLNNETKVSNRFDNGIYFIVIESDQGIEIKKLSVIN